MIVGIDPGKTGGIVTLNLDGSLQSVEAMPTVPRPTGRRTVVSHVRLRSIARRRGITVVAIEDVWGMPTDSAMSAFEFGLATGIVVGAFGVLHRIELVAPRTWQATFDLPGKAEDPDGAVRRALAVDLIPGLGPRVGTVKSTGIAEAALIAEHTRRNMSKGVHD